MTPVEVSEKKQTELKETHLLNDWEAERDGSKIKYALDKLEERGIRKFSDDRYELTKFLGEGQWGVVCEAHDNTLDMDVALKILAPTELAKRQMKHRKLNMEKIVKNEAGKLIPCSNVVPRSYGKDKLGNNYIVMDVYENDLAEELGEKEGDDFRLSLNNKSLKLDDILEISTDIATGLAEIHEKHERVHGDLKPANVQKKYGHWFINDLGTSQSIFGRTGSPRDNMGEICTRAPECASCSSKPTKESDVWSFGSLMYRMFSGEYILEDELRKGDNPESTLIELNKKLENDEDYREEFVKKINKKIKKNVPRQLRSFIQKALNIDPDKRQCDGERLQSELQKIRENMNLSKQMAKKLRMFGYPAAAIAILWAWGKFIQTSTNVSMPSNPSRAIYMPAPNTDQKPISFVYSEENIPSHPRYLGLMFEGPPSLFVGMSSEGKKYIENLLDAYEKAAKVERIYMDRNGMITDAQYQMWQSYGPHDAIGTSQVPPEFAMPEKSIEYGLSAGEIKDSSSVYANRATDKKINYVDLEKALTIARIGLPAYAEAVEEKGPKFANYINASNINQKDSEFIKTWLSYAMGKEQIDDVELATLKDAKEHSKEKYDEVKERFERSK